MNTSFLFKVFKDLHIKNLDHSKIFGMVFICYPQKVFR